MTSSFSTACAVLTVALLTTVFIGLPVLAGEPDGPSAEAILDRFVEVSGGQTAYDAISNRVTEAEVELVNQGISLAVTIYQAKPDLSYTVVESDVIGKVEKGSVDGVVWELSTLAGPQIKEGAERQTVLRDAVLDKYAYWRQRYERVERAGTAELEGGLAVKVAATDPDGLATTLYFDQASGLLVRVETVIATAMGKVPVTAGLGDYREVDGLSLPFETRVQMIGQEQKVTVKSVRSNVELPADRFQPPAEIRAMMEQQG